MNPFFEVMPKVVNGMCYLMVNVWDYFDWKDKTKWQFSSKNKSWFIYSYVSKENRFDVELYKIADFFENGNEMPTTKNGSYPFFVIWLEKSIEWDAKCRLEEPEKYKPYDDIFLSDSDVPIERRQKTCSK